jgi:uncharacterized protein YdhG (YjbR/CyaY superfamily)
LSKIKASTVDEYIQAAPEAARKHLHEIRGILKSVAPDAKETLKWGTPVFEGKRILFAYSAHKAHLNFMPTESSLIPFKEELSHFTTGKDTIQFPYDKPLPTTLIRSIAIHRARDVRENDARWMKT